MLYSYKHLYSFGENKVPLCIVYGPRDVDVASAVTQNCPEATITRFDENGGIAVVFHDDPTDTLKKAGLHVTVLDTNFSSVIWRPFIVRSSPVTIPGADEKIPQVLQRHFNGQPTNEKVKFQIPVPIPTFADSVDPTRKHSYKYDEYSILMEMVRKIEDVMLQNGITAEIGLARW